MSKISSLTSGGARRGTPFKKEGDAIWLRKEKKLKLKRKLKKLKLKQEK